MLEAAKICVETVTDITAFSKKAKDIDHSNTDPSKGMFQVVGGYISPTNDAYVQRKLGPQTISFVHRYIPF